MAWGKADQALATWAHLTEAEEVHISQAHHQQLHHRQPLWSRHTQHEVAQGTEPLAHRVLQAGKR